MIDDERWMRRALEEAARARAAGEVPIGAIVLIEGREIGAGFNQPISAIDPTAHAEVVAMRAAASAIGNYRLVGATLYVTVEPCLMCLGAMAHGRIRRVVFGALEPKSGALVSTQHAHDSAGLNHRVEMVGGVLEDECRSLLQDFFNEARGRAPRGAARP